jgi:hypothetical protein
MAARYRTNVSHMRPPPMVDHLDQHDAYLTGFPDLLLPDDLDPAISRREQARSTEYWLIKNVAEGLARLLV